MNKKYFLSNNNVNNKKNSYKPHPQLWNYLFGQNKKNPLVEAAAYIRGFTVP